jgi:hypothetical protein
MHPTPLFARLAGERVRAAQELHASHITGEIYDLEYCEWCRTEYFMTLPPLASPTD